MQLDRKTAYLTLIPTDPQDPGPRAHLDRTVLHITEGVAEGVCRLFEGGDWKCPGNEKLLSTLPEQTTLQTNLMQEQLTEMTKKIKPERHQSEKKEGGGCNTFSIATTPTNQENSATFPRGREDADDYKNYFTNHYFLYIIRIRRIIHQAEPNVSFKF